MCFQNISHQKIHTFWNCAVNDEAPSTSSHIVEQIEIIQGVFLPGISQLNDSVPDKKRKGKTQFSPRKDSKKKKNGFDIAYLLSHQLMDRVIE